LEEIYLDNAATTKPFTEVVDIMVDCLVNKYGNPSSLHRKGIEAENILKESRSKLAEAMGVQDGEILFTSGGTESNNTAIRGITRSYSNRGRHIITTRIEHPSVQKTMEDLEKDGFSITYLEVDREGVIDLQLLKDSIKKDTILVSIMGVNNEIGTVQPLKEIGRVIKEMNPLAFFHVDGIQAFLKIPIDPKDMKIDLLSISGHKFHGPKGIGALYCKRGINLRPWQTGGGQEQGLRSGTENIPGIAGIGKAVEIYNKNLKEYCQKMTDLKQRLRVGIEERIENIKINTPEGEKGAPHILSVSFRGIKGEVLVHSLERHGIYISTRSACSSKQNKISSVLASIGLDNDEAEGTVRISLCPFNSQEEIEKAVDVLVAEVNNLRRMFRR
jgi:cysteine desulfurase